MEPGSSYSIPTTLLIIHHDVNHVLKSGTLALLTNIRSKVGYDQIDRKASVKPEIDILHRLSGYQVLTIDPGRTRPGSRLSAELIQGLREKVFLPVRHHRLYISVRYIEK